MFFRNLLGKKLSVSLVAWSAVWIAVHTLALRYTFYFDWQTCVSDAVVTTALIAGTGYVLVSIMRVYQPGQLVRFMMSAGIVIICALLVKQYANVFVDEKTPYSDFLERSLFIRTIYLWLMVTLISVVSWLWFTLREQQEMQVRRVDAEKLAREAELSRLRQQLQPHFLFNSLNSISALAGVRPEEARRMIQQLSDFLRGTLKKDDQQMVPLSEELDHLKLYLDIEKVRFGHRLDTQIKHDEVSLSMKVPSLLLQPVVENAIKFGLYDTTGKTVIEIHANGTDGYLSLTVTNPFDPETAQPRQGTGFGLSSVQRRLSLLFFRNDLLTTRQEGNLFITSLKIPQAL